MAEKRTTLLKGLLFTSLLWGGLLMFFVLISDFDAERRCREALIAGGRCKLAMCGFIRAILPGALNAPCWLLNALPFGVIPGFVLWRIIQDEGRRLLDGRSRAR